MKLLHIDSSITGAHSVSRQLSRSIVAQLQRDGAELEVRYRDLAAQPVPQLSPKLQFAKLLQQHAQGTLAGEPAAMIGAAVAAGAKADPQALAELETANAALQQFLEADVIVIGAPMYNFAIPVQLKAWLDCVAAPGKTFSYSASGVQGLAGAKRVIIASARGGLYLAPSPMAALDHQESYLQGFFGFIGVTDLQIVRAEGLNLGGQQRLDAIDAALGQTAALALA